MPFDCGLAAGGVIGTRLSRSAVQIVSSAVYLLSVVGEPLDRDVGPCSFAVARGDCVLHELLDVPARQCARDRDDGNAFPVVTVERERYRHDLAVPARDLEPIATPAFVRHRATKLSRVRPSGAPACGAREFPAVQLEDTLDAREIIGRVELPVHERPHASRAVRGPRADDGADLGGDCGVVAPRVSCPTRLTVSVGTRPPNPERSTDRGHRPPGHRLDTP